MARRTQEQICRDKKNERERIYRKRKKLYSELSDPKTSNDKIQSKIDSLNGKLEDINTYLFKCGKRYQKLKKSKRALQKKRYRVRKKVESDISDKEKTALLKQLRDIKSHEVELSKAMGMKMKVKKGVISFDIDTTNEIISETDVAWRLKEKVNIYLKSKRYKKIIIGGIEYDISTDNINIQFALDKEMEDIMSFQANTKTPMFGVTLNMKSQTITLG